MRNGMQPGTLPRIPNAHIVHRLSTVFHRVCGRNRAFGAVRTNALQIRRLSVVLLILAGLSTAPVKGAASDSLHAGVSTWKLTAIGGATAAGFIVGHGLLNDLWWKGERVPFHTNWQQDWEYAIGADKVGHAVFPYAVSRAYAGMFRWAGLDSGTAIWTGAGVAYAYQTYIEIRDGFSRGYGFSWGDVAANTIGAALPVLQHYVPDLRPLTLQISFDPSQAYRDGAYGAIIDDYTSTTHWLAVNIHDLMPTSMQTWYPEWIGLAIGHSVEGLDGRGGGRHVWYVSLDWDLARIKGIPAWLREVMDVLHAFHLPAPAIRLTPEVAWLGLKF
jgi:hypothetical protein